MDKVKLNRYFAVVFGIFALFMGAETIVAQVQHGGTQPVFFIAFFVLTILSGFAAQADADRHQAALRTRRKTNQ